ncbi:MAG TPA: sn-glycerol-3-phosphate transporter [Burkholderiales bacterium]|nr:sn-glycerol-3-phosphate transporter [Burkholderiales bacterium]
MIPTGRALALLFALTPCFPAHAGEQGNGGRLVFHLAPAVYHYRHDPRHNNYPWLMGLEYESRNNWLGGAAYFRNSFDQPSNYLYLGKRWFPDFLPENVYVKVTGGILLGYKEPYENKVPLNNRKGIAPGVLPAIGYQFKRASIQLVPLGAAGLMLTLGVDLLKLD